VNLGGRNVRQIERTVARRFNGARVEVWRESAGMIPLELGRIEDASVVVLAGTGSIAVGEYPRAGSRYVCGGWGMHLGDEGSGYWIGNQAIRAALKSCEGSGPTTALGARILGSCGMVEPSNTPEQIVETRDRLRGPVLSLDRRQVAALVPTVVESAEAGDAVATEILENAGRELSRIALAIVRRLGIPASACRVLLAGGLAHIDWFLFEGFRRAIAEQLGPVDVRRSLLGLEVAAAAHVLATDAEADPQAVGMLLRQTQGRQEA
jgi:N-acetylglucosamine kinase-like BadF-type ATPase